MENEVPAATEDTTAMQNAFAAAFNPETTETKVEPKVEQKVEPKAEPTAESKVEPTVEPTVEQKVEQKEEVTPAAPPTLSEQQIKLLQAIPELERRLTQQVDKVAGNYGEMKRLLDSMQKAAATPKSAAEFEASEDGDVLDEQYPELAQGVAAKIAKAMAKTQAGMTAEQFEAAYQQRREQEKAQTLQEQLAALRKVHPDHIEIQQTPEWQPWLQTLTEAQREGVLHSFDPYYVSNMISRFKSYRDKKQADASKDKQRVERAVSPSGVRPASPSTINEDEAMRQAFAAALAS